MRDVLVTEEVMGSGMESLKKRFDVAFEPELWKAPEALMERISEFRAIIVRNQTTVNSDLIASASRLEVIGRAGAGLDNIDLDAAISANVVVVYAPEQNALAVAELTMGMMLALARKIVPADHSTKAGQWKREVFTGTELYGKILGLVGLGRVGYRVGARAKAFGMHIVAHDIHANPDGVLASESCARLVDLEDLLEQADFVSCHIPLSSETAGLFDYNHFRKMKQTAFFINTSRGGVVDEEALIRILREKRIAGAGLDVRGKEPPEQSPLSKMENVILTPHIGAFTKEGQERVISSVCRDVRAILEGREAKNAFGLSKPGRM